MHARRGSGTASPGLGIDALTVVGAPMESLSIKVLVFRDCTCDLSVAGNPSSTKVFSWYPCVSHSLAAPEEPRLVACQATSVCRLLLLPSINRPALLGVSPVLGLCSRARTGHGNGHSLASYQSAPLLAAPSFASASASAPGSPQPGDSKSMSRPSTSWTASASGPRVRRGHGSAKRYLAVAILS